MAQKAMGFVSMKKSFEIGNGSAILMEIYVKKTLNVALRTKRKPDDYWNFVGLGAQFFNSKYEPFWDKKFFFGNSLFNRFIVASTWVKSAAWQKKLWGSSSCETFRNQLRMIQVVLNIRLK